MNSQKNQSKSPDPNGSGIDWPDPQLYKKSITFEFAFYISLAVVMLMSITGYIVTSIYVKTTTRDVIDKLLIRSRSYSNSAGKFIISTKEPDELMLNNVCKKLASDNPDIFWAGIADPHNNLLAHTDIRKIITSDQMVPVKSQEFPDLLQSGEALALCGDTIFASVPILESEIVVGRLTMASSNYQITRARRNSIITIAIVATAMIFVGIPLAMIMIRRKLRSITTITRSLQQINMENLAVDISIKENNELGYLADTISVMGAKLNLAQKKLIESERMAKELEIAREIQKSILPRGFPKTDSFEFAGGYRSAREVGGDYYDFMDFGDEYLAFLVADVSGKSLPGMLIMLLTRDIIKELTRSIQRPAELLKQVNRELKANIKKGTFVTMFYGLINKKTGEFTFASAGHNPLIKLNGSGGDPVLLKTNGYPLGMMPVEQFNGRIETGQISLQEGDILVQYTDGINEALNSSQTEFGMPRFLQALNSTRHSVTEKIVEGVFDQLESFVGPSQQYDDITLIVLKWLNNKVEMEKHEKPEGISANR
jgi:serine phosphatase RsbU (regulator of sigma subunit)